MYRDTISPRDGVSNPQPFAHTLHVYISISTQIHRVYNAERSARVFLPLLGRADARARARTHANWREEEAAAERERRIERESLYKWEPSASSGLTPSRELALARTQIYINARVAKVRVIVSLTPARREASRPPLLEDRTGEPCC